MSKRSTQPKKQTIVSNRVSHVVRAFSSSLPKSPPTKLYRFVYSSATSVFVVFFLLASFLMQGIYVVQASEIDTSSSLTTIPIPMTEESAAPSTLSEHTETIEDTSEEVHEDEVVVPLVVPATTDDVAGTVDGDDDLGIELNGDKGEETSADSSEATENTQSTSTGEEGVIDDEDETDTSVEPEPETTLESGTSGEQAEPLIGTSTELIGPERTLPVGENYSDSGYVFSKTECTELASGSFYCLEPKINVLPDALFAAPDADGDLEIFLVRDGIQTQVTDNFVDDAAPFFDKNSDTLVWHRLLDDRYQIVSYTISSGEEILLTRGSSNNMEPVRQGDYTVWQRWVDNNWEVILHDGDTEEQISHSATHDIAPYIHGSLIVWNRYSATGEKTVEMYDIKTRTYVTVDDPDGMSVANPRMVLVYDQLHPNGDIVTKGFDMIERQFIHLDTLPREIPERLPESEPTDETRALIQSKPTQKSEGQVEIEPDSEGTVSNPGEAEAAGIATSTDVLTLDLREEVQEPIIVEETYESQFDLVVEPFTGVQSDSTSSTTAEQAS